MYSAGPTNTIEAGYGTGFGAEFICVPPGGAGSRVLLSFGGGGGGGIGPAVVATSWTGGAGGGFGADTYSNHIGGGGGCSSNSSNDRLGLRDDSCSGSADVDSDATAGNLLSDFAAEARQCVTGGYSLLVCGSGGGGAGASMSGPT
jgi:hypothetical protein